MTDTRGVALLEWIHSLDLNLLNDGKVPTLVRSTGKSYVDITAVSEEIMREVTEWKVLDRESLSGHKQIKLVLAETQRSKKGAWRYGRTDIVKFREMLKRNMEESKYPKDVDSCSKIMEKARQESTCKIPITREQELPYWWSEDIETLIKTTRQKRRKYQRTDRDDIRSEQLREEYSESKKQLRKEIGKAKKRKWEELCQNLNEVIFGQGYRIVLNQLKITNPQTNMTLQEKERITKDLFITGKEHRFTMDDIEVPTLFNREEILQACDKVKTGKAPGPDGLTPEVVKEAIKSRTEYFKGVFNNILSENSYPDIWKTSRLILIEKPKGSPTEEAKYRPICLINVLGKVYENLINKRLMEEVRSKGGLHEKQYGFREKRSTLNAIEDVVKIAKEANREESPKWCGAIFIDVQNAFNNGLVG